MNVATHEIKNKYRLAAVPLLALPDGYYVESKERFMFLKVLTAADYLIDFASYGQEAVRSPLLKIAAETPLSVDVDYNAALLQAGKYKITAAGVPVMSPEAFLVLNDNASDGSTRHHYFWLNGHVGMWGVFHDKHKWTLRITSTELGLRTYEIGGAGGGAPMDLFGVASWVAECYNLHGSEIHGGSVEDPTLSMDEENRMFFLYWTIAGTNLFTPTLVQLTCEYSGALIAPETKHAVLLLENE